MRETWVPMIAQIVATCFHCLLCHVFIVEWGWDMYGLGLASTLTSFILLATTEAYSHCLESVSKSLFWPNSTVWDDWREYFALGFPTTGMLIAE